jgi:hypothetical protein
MNTNHKKQAQNQQAEFTNLPLLPLSELQSVMPHYIKESMRVFNDDNQKATVMIASITAMSALFPNVRGLYDIYTVRPNIYSLILAHAASGKGAMRFARKLVSPINQYLHESTPPPQEGKPPHEKMLIIPANITKSQFFQHLRDNYQSALMIESEATLKSALKGDYDDFSDILRKLFHHEPVRKSTVGDGFSSVEDGALSVVLSGTPAQIGFIDSVENGLFSRFLMYFLPDNYEWRDVTPRGKVYYDDHFNALGGQLLKDWQFFQSRATFDNPLKFDLTPSQWDKLNSEGRELTGFIKSLGIEGEALRATGVRIFVIAYRIAMTLTLTDEITGRQSGRALTCKDDYFEAALTITDVCFDHAHAAASRMLNREHKVKPNPMRTFS